MSIDRLKLLRNIGQFDSVDAGAQLVFNKLTLIYAENGRGKTTLATVLRSVCTDDSQLVVERTRLGAEHPPHIVIESAGQSVVFRDDAWSTPLPDVVVFDDTFVSTNVCSGIEIEATHRQNLHELILGKEGVELNEALLSHISEIDRLNKELRLASRAIEPVAAKVGLSVDNFCALPLEPDIEAAMAKAERNVAAAKAADSIRQRLPFVATSLPSFNMGVLNKVLGRTLPDLEAEAVGRVTGHFHGLGEGGEAWVNEGMSKVGGEISTGDFSACPFCAQSLEESPLIDHYRAYFSDAYERHKGLIDETTQLVELEHGGDIPSAFERSVRVLVQTREFWKSFVDIPEIDIDTAAVIRDWNAACEAVNSALTRKASAPLEVLALSPEAVAMIEAFHARGAELERLMVDLEQVNKDIAVTKESADSADLDVAEADLLRYQAIRDRHNDPKAKHCQKYLDVKALKTESEKARDEARKALDHYREAIFPMYQNSINEYLKIFNAGFRLDSVGSVNNRAGSSCTYSVLINEVPVGLNAKMGPSFRNTLSSGDRNTLALAFFFASLRQDLQLPQKIVVIDDPMTSLDEHRSLATRQELRRLQKDVSQVIVLSHSKPFLCALWEESDDDRKTAIIVQREGKGSTLSEWNVHDDCVTEHDHRYKRVQSYTQTGDAAVQRMVAEALRPILEVFIRVAYPINFKPGSLLGPFIGICRQRLQAGQAILSGNDIEELRALLDYANKFHHDSNPAWETAAINDGELLDNCERVLAFCKRS